MPARIAFQDSPKRPKRLAVQEEQLSRDWLNAREKYDAAARSLAVLHQVDALVKEIAATRKANPMLADLGCGTGNNVLFLQEHLPQSTHYQLIEQHGFLLKESQRRLVNSFSSNTANLHFNQDEIHSWLEENHADMLTNSALLDLLTRTELSSLLQYMEENRTPMYCTLNYRGVTFIPADDNDADFIAAFEQHMSRNLDRGNPLGAATCSTLEQMVNESPGLKMTKANSDWSVPASDSDFIKMNLDFYDAGIRQVLNENTQHALIDRWMETKLRQLEDQTLSLIVHHRDYLIIPN